MRFAGKTKRFLWLAILLAAAGFGCAEKTPQMAGPPPVQPPVQPPAQTKFEDGVFYAPSLGLYWTGPSDFKPVKSIDQEDFLFGWDKPKEKLATRLMNLPVRGLREAAAALAQAKGWQMYSFQEITWQGRPAGDAVYAAGENRICVRLLAGPDGVLAVYGQGPAKDFGQSLPKLVGVIEGFRLVPGADVLHTVKSAKESLDLIALWYTGGANNWGKLKNYNKLDSNRVSPGQQIKIPRELVWRLDPMPVWAVRLYGLGRREAKKAPAKAQEEEGSRPGLDLIPAGPK